MTTVGALIGLAIAIVLIVLRLSPVYSLMLGALTGALVGGLSLVDTVGVMTEGVKDITPAVIRILAAGVLSGVLIKSGAAVTLSNAIIRFFGERFMLAAIAFTTMLLTGVGVFIDVAVVTIAPIALAAGMRLKVPAPVLLMAMIGGGKCGNIISPNPNTIIAAENLHAELPRVMAAGIAPALVGLLFTVFVVLRFMPRRGNVVEVETALSSRDEGLPSLATSLVAPVVTIVLLALRPVFGINIDPLVALPVGGIAGCIAMGQWRKMREQVEHGLSKMMPIAVLLIGTGTIAGVIKNSGIKDVVLDLLARMNVDSAIIAPLSGSLMSAATASTTAGATVASASFGDILLASGVAGVWGAAMINAGATMLDHLPHGSFFHATGGVCSLTFKQRLALIPWETLVGFILAATSTAMFMIMR